MAVNDLTATLGADISGFEKGLDKAGRKLTDFDKKVQSISKLGSKFKSVGKSLTTGVSAPLAALGALSVKTFSDFSAEMSKVQAVSGATSSEIKDLTQRAKELGRTTRFTASDVAGLQLNLSKLGFNTDDIQKSTKSILDLSTATGEDLAQSAEVAASTLQGFGLDTAETGRIADVMAKSFSSSALDLNKFSIAMATVAPVAQSAGQSIETATGFLSMLANSGLEASTAGTSLRNIFLELSKQGITLDQAFSQIQNSTDKSKTAMELFGKRGATAAVILAENAQQASELTKEYENASGAAAKMAEIMNNNLNGAMLELKSAFEGAAIEIGEVLAPYVQKLAGYASKLAGYFSNLSPTAKKVAVAIGAVAAAAGPLILGLGALMTALPAIISGVGALGSVLTLATGPIGLVAAGVAAIAYAIYDNWGHIKSYIVDTVNYFIDLYNESEFLRVAVSALVTNFKIGFAIVSNVLKTTYEVVKSVVQGIADKFSGLGTIMSGVFTGNVDKIKQGVLQIGKSTTDTILTIKDDIVKGFQDMSDDVTEAFYEGMIAANSREKIDGVTEENLSGLKESVAGKVQEQVSQGFAEGFSNIQMQPVGQDLESGGMFNLGGGIEADNEKLALGLQRQSQLMTEAEFKQLEANERWKQLSADFANSVMSNAAGAIGSTFENIGSAIASGGNVMQAMGQSLLSAFVGFLGEIGDMLIKYGTLAIAKGKIDTAIAAGGPASIAAGAAALVVGAALKAVSGAMGSKAKGGFSGGGGSGGRYDPSTDVQAPTTRTNTSQTFSGDGKVVFEIEGQKLVGVLSKTLNKNKKLGGSSVL